MSEENWKLDFAKSPGVYMNGLALRMKGEKGEEIMDDSFYIIFNAAHHPLKYKLPAEEFGTTWIQMIDTNTGHIEEPTNI
jgi:glycogen operon protein